MPEHTPNLHNEKTATVYYLLLCVSHINVVPLEGRTDTVMEGQLLQLNISLPGLKYRHTNDDNKTSECSKSSAPTT